MAIETESGGGGSVVDAAEMLEGLNDLLQLDHDAIGAYQVAIEKLQDPAHAQQVQSFLHDHERHVRELNHLVQGLGGVPRNEPHATGPFRLALQGLGTLGGDRGTLMAFRTNELQVRMKYQGYAAKSKLWPREVHAVIERSAMDEERHYRWVSEALQAMGTGGPTVTERAKEIGGVAAVLSADALERAAARLGSIAQVQAAQGGPRGRAADAARRLAGSMGATAGFLRDPDAQELREKVEQQVRTQPFAVLATTFVAGFLIGRLLR